MPRLVKALFPNGPLLCAALLSRASGQLSVVVWDRFCCGGVAFQRIEDGEREKEPVC